jgi:membrane-associated PAP2 superfamily phosphatase
MPVDHPTPPPGAVRPVRARFLTMTLSFLVTLGILLAISPLLAQANFLS